MKQILLKAAALLFAAAATISLLTTSQVVNAEDPIDYDTDLDRHINRVEARSAVKDYFNNLISQGLLLEVLEYWRTRDAVPVFTLAVMAVSPTELQLTWDIKVVDPTDLEIRRSDGVLLPVSMNALSFLDTGLSPNTPYTYEAFLGLSADTTVEHKSAAVTLASIPGITRPMGVHATGFRQPIVDDHNPSHTEYKVTLRNTRDGAMTVSDWSTNKCRPFQDLQPGVTYDVMVTARNLYDMETAPAIGYAESYGSVHTLDSVQVHTWGHRGTDDAWVKERIQDVYLLFGLTDSAVDWMNNNILVERQRGEPGWAGYGAGYVGIGHSFPATLLHEAMHAYWEYWDAFPKPCDEMNLFTYYRDVARFGLEFREYETLGEDNPLEPWRPYYNVIDGFQEFAELGEDDYWEVLERGEYGRVWWALYHKFETTLPIWNPKSLEMVPPSLGIYLDGFMEMGESRTWEDELDWYARLEPEDKHLWDSHILTHEVAHQSGIVLPPPEANIERARIPEPLRSALRKIDRQLLVDFINDLQYVAPWEWNTDPGWNFKNWFVTQHLYRLSLYESELNASVGIELDDNNLDAVIEILDLLFNLHCKPDSLHCGVPPVSPPITSDAVIQAIETEEHLTDTQRKTLLEFVDLGDA